MLERRVPTWPRPARNRAEIATGYRERPTCALRPSNGSHAGETLSLRGRCQYQGWDVRWSPSKLPETCQRCRGRRGGASGHSRGGRVAGVSFARLAAISAIRALFQRQPHGFNIKALQSLIANPSSWTGPIGTEYRSVDATASSAGGWWVPVKSEYCSLSSQNISMNRYGPSRRDCHGGTLAPVQSEKHSLTARLEGPN